MAQLQIALHGGFADDKVVVHIDGREVYRREDVTTRMQLGLADSFTVELPQRPAGVPAGTPTRVSVSVRGIEGTADVRPEETPFLAVSIRNDRITFRTSATPFGYL